MAEHVCRNAHRDLFDPPGKAPFRAGRFGKEHFQRRIEPRPRPRRTGDQQRLFPAGEKLRVEQEERQPAEMIAVQMREDDRVDAVGIDALPFQRRHGRGAAVDQQRALGGLQEEAGIEPATRAEGVAGTCDGQFHSEFIRVHSLFRSFPRKREPRGHNQRPEFPVLGPRWSLCSGQPKAGPGYGDERRGLTA